MSINIYRSRTTFSPIGYCHLGMRLFVYTGMVTFLLFALLPAFDSLGQAVHMAAIWGAISGFLFAVSRMRIEGDDSSLQVRNVIWVWRIPLRQVAGIMDANGLKILTLHRREIEVMAYGSSLVALWTGNRRGKLLSARLRPLVVNAQDSGGGEVTRKPNLELLALPILLCLIYCVLGILGHLILH